MQTHPCGIARLAPSQRLAALLAFAFLIFAALSQSPARADVSLDARIGFGQSAPGASRYRPGSWTPVTVYLG